MDGIGIVTHQVFDHGVPLRHPRAFVKHVRNIVEGREIDFDDIGTAVLEQSDRVPKGFFLNVVAIKLD